MLIVGVSATSFENPLDLEINLIVGTEDLVWIFVPCVSIVYTHCVYYSMLWSEFYCVIKILPQTRIWTGSLYVHGIPTRRKVQSNIQLSDLIYPDGFSSIKLVLMGWTDSEIFEVKTVLVH